MGQYLVHTTRMAKHMNPLKAFARLLRIRDDQAEDALYNARAAKLVLSRRSFVGVGAALATGAAFSFYKQLDYLPWNDPSYLYVALKDDHDCEYARVAVKRSPDSWRIKSDELSTVQPVVFPASNGSTIIECSKLVVYRADGRALFDGGLNTRVRTAIGVTPVIHISVKDYGLEGKFGDFKLKGELEGKLLGA